jgi:hypothetical protein
MAWPSLRQLRVEGLLPGPLHVHNVIGQHWEPCAHPPKQQPATPPPPLWPLAKPHWGSHKLVADKTSQPRNDPALEQALARFLYHFPEQVFALSEQQSALSPQPCPSGLWTLT